MLYKIIKSAISDAVMVYQTEKEQTIPCDEGNIDYREYLAWLAEGNVPDESN